MAIVHKGAVYVEAGDSSDAFWERTNFTQTYFGRGDPLTAVECLDHVRAAFTECHGTAYGIEFEDYGFIPAAQYAEAVKADPESDVVKHKLVKTTRPIRNSADAVRAWWNDFAHGVLGTEWEKDYTKNIYVGGKGPDGIGGFTKPT